MTAGDSPPTPVPRQIGIAIVMYDGKVLVGVRGPDGPLPGMAEFPGGKCEPGEAPDECACRECAEETGLCVAVDQRLHDVVWDYPHGRVHLHFVQCRPRNAVDVATRQREFRWVGPEELSVLNFPEANRPVVHELLRRLTGAVTSE